PFQVNSSGTSTFVVDSNGNVGMGTTRTGKALLSVMNGDVGIGTFDPAGLLQIGTSKTNSFVVNPSGNVGIGTLDTSGGALIVMNGNVGIQNYPSNCATTTTFCDAYTGPTFPTLKVAINSANYTGGIDFWTAGTRDSFFGHRGSSSNAPNYQNAMYLWA